jgi:DNA-binding SARP family transcriptional activator/Tfp pilus assembly protein PilF
LDSLVAGGSRLDRGRLMFVLKLLGGALLEDAAGVYAGPAVQRHRLALLAILAISRGRALPREKLMALLWPERDAQQARRLLNQSVYVLRRALGEEAILTVSDALRLQPHALRCDAVEFEAAINAGEPEKAAGIYQGSFLDGFFLTHAPDFERWVEDERRRLADLQAQALKELAVAAEERGEVRVAVGWWKAQVTHDPLDSTAVLRLVQALEAAGDPSGALQQAAVHERMLREELAVGLPADLVAVVTRLREAPANTAAMQQPARPSIRPTTTAPMARAPSREAARAGGPVPPSRLRRVSVFGAVALLIVAGALVANRMGPRDLNPVVQDEAGEANKIAPIDAAVLPPERRTTSIAAYELYRRASDPVVLRDDGTARQALEYLRQAVALDPAYAAAWAGLARLTVRVNVVPLGRAIPEEEFRFALQAAHRAVELDDSLAEGHAFLGALQAAGFDFAAAEASFARAIALEPARSITRQWRMGLYLWTARPAEALVEAERAAAIDPLSPAGQAEVARALSANGRCREALARLERLEAVEPPLLRVPMIAAQCKAQLQSWESAIAALRDVPGGHEPLSEGMLGYLLARTARRDEALQVLESLLVQHQQGLSGAFPLAVVHAGLGDFAEALTWLERAIEDRSLLATIVHFTVLQPVVGLLDGDPRLERLPPAFHHLAALYGGQEGTQGY